nr:unnamed protein product [Spirometra erinaceieuropaei]
MSTACLYHPPKHREAAAYVFPWGSVPKARTCSRPSLLPSPSPLVAQCREFADALNEDTRERLNRLTKATRVVILMKGNPSQPRCGFSNAVCRILEAHGVLDKVDKNGTSIVSSFDVLEDNDIREGAKIFSDWPTFPQVYFDGEFVGGCDILLDMHRSGKLAAELNRLGIESKLSPEPPSSS